MNTAKGKGKKLFTHNNIIAATFAAMMMAISLTGCSSSNGDYRMDATDLAKVEAQGFENVDFGYSPHEYTARGGVNCEVNVISHEGEWVVTDANGDPTTINSQTRLDNTLRFAPEFVGEDPTCLIPMDEQIRRENEKLVSPSDAVA